MDSEQEEKLLQFLESIGFKGEPFRSEMLGKTRLFLPTFNVKYNVDFGEERMLFDLYFRRDVQFEAYRLERYKATHRRPVQIEHKVVNGHDTAILEKRMQRENWEEYFNDKNSYRSPLDRSFVEETIAVLNKIAAQQNFDGIKIQEELIFKYWPEGISGHDTQNDLKSVYDRTIEFKPTDQGVANVNLAFYQASGRFDVLYERLLESGIEMFPGINVYSRLEKELSKNSGEFEITAWNSDQYGYYDYAIPVVRHDREYKADTIIIVMRSYTPIEHGLYNGIDTTELDSLFRKIDWKDDSIIFIHQGDDEPVFPADVEEVLQKMNLLSQDKKGAEIADQLAIRYWSEATFFDTLIEQTGWDILEMLPKIRQEFPIEYNTSLAYNLMRGQAVTDNHVYPGEKESQHWVKLDMSDPRYDGDYPFKEIKGTFSKDEITQLLNLVPLSHRSRRDIELLIQGEQLKKRLLNGVTVFIEANPEEKTLDIYSLDGKKIPVNLRFDPDWKGPGVQIKNVVIDQAASIPKKKNHRRTFPNRKPG